MINIHTLTCPICNRIFTSENMGICCGSLIAHAKTKHGLNTAECIAKFNIDESSLKAYRTHQCQYSKRKLRDPNYIQQVNKKLLDKLGIDEFNKLPKCELCEYRGKQLYMHIFNLHNMTIDEYKTKFTSNLATPEYLEYLSISRTGNLNPMYNNGRSECSPWAVEFYAKKGYSHEDSIKMKDAFIKQVNEAKSDDSHTTHISYYMKKHNVDYAEGTRMLTERQTTNSVDNIAKRNNISIEQAQVIRNNITTKWCTTISNKSESDIIEMNRKKLAFQSVSKISKSFIDHLLMFTGISYDDILFDTNELTLITPDTNNKFGHKCFMYDFTYKNKIIEFNGDMIHANPSIYLPNDLPLARFKKSFTNRYDWTAQMLWDYDASKKILADSKGYTILVVWDSEWKKDKENILRKCKEFLGV